MAGYFGAGWGQFNCLHAAPTCLVVHQSSSRKVRTTIFYKIGVRETLWSKDHQSPMVNFLPNLAKSKVHSLDSLQFFLLSHFTNHLHKYFYELFAQFFYELSAQIIFTNFPRNFFTNYPHKFLTNFPRNFFTNYPHKFFTNFPRK